jgi:hypothetical protein
MSSETESPNRRNIWQRLNGPAKIGLVFAAVGIVLTGMGALISGGTWGLVSWAIATAAVEVERDVAEAERKDDAA